VDGRVTETELERVAQHAATLLFNSVRRAEGTSMVGGEAVGALLSSSHGRCFGCAWRFRWGLKSIRWRVVEFAFFRWVQCCHGHFPLTVVVAAVSSVRPLFQRKRRDGCE
jgi:hypothetical protein